ncbi:DMT family transporter [Palaeococcus ferrophilus]|uniref:DMT family transporter n=1 Tax=Palaeococcus ferrophilus TaxID=83868 RepID=UPI00064F0043|nr:DMT family transporter [Palaeococcus ferrophilus]
MTMITGILYALTSALGWGTASVLIKMGMKNRKAVTANIVRLYFVALLYIGVIILGGRVGDVTSLSARQLTIAFISAQFGFVIGDYFYFNALRIAGVSRTVPITSSYPLWAILWAYLFLGRSVTLNVIIGALLVFSAILIVRRAEEREHIEGKGFVFALLAPISWSLAITLLDYLSSSIDVFTLAAIRMIFAAVGVSVFLPRYAGDLKSLTLRELLILASAGILGLFIGQYAFVAAVSTIGSQIATPVTAINPIVSSTLAIIVLKEPPNSRILLGLILAVAGIVVISLG